MPYIDSTYYLEEFKGKPLKTPSDIDRLIKRASDRIQGLINNKITPENIEDAFPLHKRLLKQATAELVEHYEKNEIFTTKKDSGLKSVSVGSFNYTVDKESIAGQSSESDIPFTVLDTLSQTGLLYAGLNSHGGF